MLFHNTYEIDENADRYIGHEILEPATRTLQNLRDWADANSDGWCYWPKPCRAAKRLQELINQGARAERSGFPAPTRADLVKAYAPIKAFRTRHGADFEIILPA